MINEFLAATGKIVGTRSLRRDNLRVLRTEVKSFKGLDNHPASARSCPEGRVLTFNPLVRYEQGWSKLVEPGEKGIE